MLPTAPRPDTGPKRKAPHPYPALELFCITRQPDGEEEINRLLGHAVEVVQDSRIHIEKINGPMLFVEKASPAEYKGGLTESTLRDPLLASQPPVLISARIRGVNYTAICPPSSLKAAASYPRASSSLRNPTNVSHKGQRVRLSARGLPFHKASRPTSIARTGPGLLGD
jgi:hypothetical protein